MGRKPKQKMPEEVLEEEVKQITVKEESKEVHLKPETGAYYE